MEIDFMSVKGHKVCPLEVKSAEKINFSSLTKFKERFADRVLPGMVIYDGDYKVENNIEFIPIFAIDWYL